MFSTPSSILKLSKLFGTVFLWAKKAVKCDNLYIITRQIWKCQRKLTHVKVRDKAIEHVHSTTNVAPNEKHCVNYCHIRCCITVNTRSRIFNMCTLDMDIFTYSQFFREPNFILIPLSPVNGNFFIVPLTLKKETK